MSDKDPQPPTLRLTIDPPAAGVTATQVAKIFGRGNPAASAPISIPPVVAEIIEQLGHPQTAEMIERLVWVGEETLAILRKLSTAIAPSKPSKPSKPPSGPNGSESVKPSPESQS